MNKLTPEYIESLIEEEHYVSGYDAAKVKSDNPSEELKRATICILKLNNGAIVTGASYVATLDNNDPIRGRQAARQRALEEIWKLEGYALTVKLHKLPSNMPINPDGGDAEYFANVMKTEGKL